jgi:hypothetical protein
MTEKEFYGLRPGDKIIFKPLPSEKDDDWTEESLAKQEENGGYLVVISIFICGYDFSEYEVSVEKLYGIDFVPSEIELYKPQPWSYERDY